VRFRTGVLLGMLLLVVGIVAATLVAATLVIDSSARADLAASLVRDRHVFEDLQAYRQTLFRTEGRVVADEPRLRAVVATEEITHETVLGVARELRQAVGCDLFLITDADGQLMADIADPSASGDDMSANPLVAKALKEEEATGVWTDEAGAYQVQARRLDFGRTIVGVLVVGYKLDNAVADTVSRQTGSSVVVQMAGKTIAASHAGDEGAATANDAALTAVPVDAASPVEIGLAGQRYVAVSSPFPGYAGERPLRYVLLRSLDRALAPRLALTRVLYLILAAASALALVLGLVFSRRLSRPLDQLVHYTDQIAAGNLTTRGVSGPREFRALGDAMNHMVTEIAEGRRQLASQEQIRRELQIAAQIQTSILPRNVKVEGLEIATRMLPAEEVGGDYFDFVPVAGACWIGVGDVAGHGLTAGLVMMMIQSVVASLTRNSPGASPRQLVALTNDILFDNIRARMRQDEHVTFCLMKYTGSGKFVFAGAHEELLVCPAGGGPCLRVQTPGSWLGTVHDLASVTVDSTLQLAQGDVLVLFTDGITEAMNADSEQFGLDRLCAAIEDARAKPVDDIRDRVLDTVREWCAQQNDDMTLIVIRYSGERAA
jgi:sigma-B regulation protein RsbU (phosphoserine phosphatase)